MEKPVNSTEVMGGQIEKTTVSSSDSTNSLQTPDYLSFGAFILGIFNLASWILPICGCPMNLLTIGLAIGGLKSSKYKWMSIAALIVSILSLIVTIINSLAGAYIASHNYSY